MINPDSDTVNWMQKLLEACPIRSQKLASLSVCFSSFFSGCSPVVVDVVVSVCVVRARARVCVRAVVSYWCVTRHRRAIGGCGGRRQKL